MATAHDQKATQAKLEETLHSSSISLFLTKETNYPCKLTIPLTIQQYRWRYIVVNKYAIQEADQLLSPKVCVKGIIRRH